MDITNTTTDNTVTSTIKTPEPKSETQIRIQSSAKPVTFTNGLLKRHQPLAVQPPPPTVYVYRECLKNHAATLGGHSLDGCGEFMSSPCATPTDPTSLKCAACGCHRNFHRRSTDQSQLAPLRSNNRALIEYQPHHRHHPPPPRDVGESPNSASPPPISSAYYPASAPHMLLALGAGLSGPQPDKTPPIWHGTGPIGHGNGRKRFRTKFSENQKEKMLEFAEKVGWKFQKRDEDAISEFCSEIGVDRGVLKVWMHNNKSNLGKKSEYNNSNNGNGVGFGNREIDGKNVGNNSDSVGSPRCNNGGVAANGAIASSSSS